MKKLELIKFTLELLTKAEQWIDKIPFEIRDTFFDNPYSNSCGRVMDAALETSLGEDLYELVMWWIYDTRYQILNNGYTTIEVNKGIASVRYILKCDQDFLEYLVTEYPEITS